jgi:hypothetical protein
MAFHFISQDTSCNKKDSTHVAVLEINRQRKAGAASSVFVFPVSNDSHRDEVWLMWVLSPRHILCEGSSVLIDWLMTIHRENECWAFPSSLDGWRIARRPHLTLCQRWLQYVRRLGTRSASWTMMISWLDMDGVGEPEC